MITTSPVRAALVAAFLFLVHTAAFAQTGLIRGKVVGPDGKPVQGAVVTIEFQGGVTRSFTAKTDKKGEFTQLGLQSGTYKITAVADKLTAVGQANVRVGNTAEVNLALAPPAGDDAAAAVRKVFDEGNALVQAKNWDGAVAKFEEAAGIVQNCGDCYYNIGFVRAQQKDDARAEAAYKKALELKPDHTASMNALAALYNSQKRFDEAAAISAKAAGGGAGGGSADAIYNQGIILWNAGKIPEAKEKFQQTITADPNHASGHFQLGMAMLNTGEVAPAVTEFETYLKLEPSGQFAAQAKQMVDQLKK
jgi:tetratricopeptide (TPR) repeat protein